MEEILRIEHISKSFPLPLSFKKLLRLGSQPKGRVCALQDISFSLKKNSVLCVLGPNGAGKTTLLKIISTLIMPDKGAVLVNGHRLGKEDEKIKSLVGLMLNEERSFYWRLSGRQNLEFFASLYGLKPSQTKSRIEQLLQLFQIDYAQRRFDSYSTGMKRKFALLRCLLHKPQLLLFDEPTKSLDYNSSQEMLRYIQRLPGEGKAVVVTTHNLAEAEMLSDEFIILHNGRLRGSGGLEELRQKTGLPGASLLSIYRKLISDA